MAGFPRCHFEKNVITPVTFLGHSSASTWQQAVPCSRQPKLDDREINMSKIAKESILLMSLFLIAATVQFFAQSLPMALCFYFLPTLYSAYHFGRRHATLTAFACIFLVVLLDFLNNMMPGHRVVSLPGERLFNFAIWAGVLAVVGYVMGTLY